MADGTMDGTYLKFMLGKNEGGPRIISLESRDLSTEWPHCRPTRIRGNPLYRRIDSTAVRRACTAAASYSRRPVNADAAARPEQRATPKIPLVALTYGKADHPGATSRKINSQSTANITVSHVPDEATLW